MSVFKYNPCIHYLLKNNRYKKNHFFPFFPYFFNSACFSANQFGLLLASSSISSALIKVSLSIPSTEFISIVSKHVLMLSISKLVTALVSLS
jgi:hypothetical protein